MTHATSLVRDEARIWGCEADLVLFDIEGAGHGFVHHECERDGWDYCYANEVFDLLTEAERFFAEHPLPE